VLIRPAGALIWWARHLFCEAAKAASQKRCLMVMRAPSERLHHHQTLVSKFGITDVYYLS
jgi:hypothetical protein